jgi:hypothetical protein
VEIVVEKAAQGQVYSEYFGFPCQFSNHRLLHIHHLSFVAGTVGQLIADLVTQDLDSEGHGFFPHQIFIF